MKKISVYLLLVLLAIMLFWFGGYYSFINSNNWIEIEATIKNSDEIVKVVGKVQEVNTSPFSFYYRFSGNWAETKLKLVITGTSGKSEFSIEAMKNNSPWVVRNIQRE